MRPIVWLALLLAAPSPAQAHIVSSRLGDFYGGVLHPLTALPDVILWLALGLLGAAQPTRWTRWLVVLFPLGLSIGFAAGRLLGVSPDPMLADAVLMVGFGGLVAAAIRLPGPLLLALAVALALFRGVANASGVEASTDAVLFAAGLVGCGYAAITLALALAAAFRRSDAGWQAIAVRAGGSWIAAIGLMVGGYALATP